MIAKTIGFLAFPFFLLPSSFFLLPSSFFLLPSSDAPSPPTPFHLKMGKRVRDGGRRLRLWSTQRLGWVPNPSGVSENGGTWFPATSFARKA